MSSGEATELRSAMVSNDRLASACLDTGLHKMLRGGSRALADLVRFHAWKHEGGQSALVPASRHVGQGGAAAEAAPKVLADIVESLVGAAYLDSGGDLEATAKVCGNCLIAPPLCMTPSNCCVPSTLPVIIWPVSTLAIVVY